MADKSRRRKLLEYVEGRMAVISVLNGYWHDVAVVRRRHPTLEQMEGARSPLISVQGGAQQTDPTQRRSGKDVAQFLISVRGHLKISQNLDSRDMDDKAENLLQDIHRAFFTGDIGMGCDARTSYITDTSTVSDTGLPGWLTCEVTFAVEFDLVWATP